MNFEGPQTHALPSSDAIQLKPHLAPQGAARVKTGRAICSEFISMVMRKVPLELVREENGARDASA